MESKPNIPNSYSGFVEQNYEYLVDRRAADAASSLRRIWNTSETETNNIINTYLQSVIMDEGIDLFYNKLHALMVLREKIKTNDALLAILETKIELLSEFITKVENSDPDADETNT